MVSHRSQSSRVSMPVRSLAWLGWVVCLAALAAPLLASTQWPGFRGPSHDGAVHDVRLFDDGTPALEVAWKQPLGSGYSSVVVADGRVITMLAAGEVDVMAAFDTATGNELWRYIIGDTYAGHDGSHDGPISTPLVEGSTVYGLGAWGHLFALDATTGEARWTKHLVDDFSATKPHYGFTTSPVMVDGTLVVMIGAGEGKAIAGFDPANGELRWSLGDEAVEYHSPAVATLGGRQQLVASTITQIFGIDAKTGDTLWSYDHGGDERAMGGATIVPVAAGEGRLFLLNKIDSSAMLQVSHAKGEWTIEELWSNNVIARSYVIPVYHDGHLYGMNNRVFTCLDAATGERKWRSREPGDGFPTLVGDHLVVNTKPGGLYVVEATPEAYREVASLELFEEHSWSSVAYADGAIFARSMATLARIDPVIEGAEESTGGSWLMATRFGEFLQGLESAADKNAMIESWMAEQGSFPVVEGPGIAHFVFRGEAEDIGIVGDMIGFRREDPMTRVAGTDFFHYSTRLEPDAAVSYGFIVDFAEPAADTLNPHKASGLFGDVSWFSMPAYRAPDYLGEAKATGRLVDFEWESKALEGKSRGAQIYLPAGYDADSERRYQVAYINGGKDMLENGQGKNALDNLLGTSVEPLIVVFILPDAENPRQDQRQADAYMQMVVEELVPHVDGTYRTQAHRLGRALVGAADGGNMALTGAFKHSDTFAKVAAQSAMLGATEMQEMVGTAEDQTMVVYLEWGTYHLRSPHEAWDMADNNRELWSLLRERGYRPTGGEVPEGFTWACWKGRTADWLQALFPMS